MSPRTLTVAGVQMLAQPRAWAVNTARAAVWIDVAVDAGARLVLLPELFAIGSFYAPDLTTFVEPPMGRTARWLLTVAQEHHIVVAGTILEHWERHVRNTLLVAEPNGQLHRYAKRQLGPVEAQFITAGREPNVLTTSIGRVGCLICSDGGNAELQQNIMRAGVDLVLVPQATGATEQLGRFVEGLEAGGRRPLWGPIVRALGAPAVTAGLVGVFENSMPELIGNYLRGGTYVIDAAGRGLVHVPFPEEGVAVATVRLGSATAIG